MKGREKKERERERNDGRRVINYPSNKKTVESDETPIILLAAKEALRNVAVFLILAFYELQFFPLSVNERKYSHN